MGKNPWIDFVREFRSRASNKGQSLKDSLKKASVEWKKKKKAPAKKQKNPQKKSQKVEHLGGAIDDRVKKVKFVEPTVGMRVPIFNQGFPMYPLHNEPGFPGWMTVGLPSLEDKMNVPGDILIEKVMGENDVATLIKKLTANEFSAKKHHPAVAQVISHSLKQYPGLHHHYIHS